MPRIELFRKDVDWSIPPNLSLEFFKFLISALGFGIVLFGYSYSHAYFRSFGMFLFEIDMSTIDIIYRGVAQIADPEIAIYFTLITAATAALIVSRSYLRPSIWLVIISFAVVFLLWVILKLGQTTGEDHAKAIWAQGDGKKVFCRFDPKTDPRGKLLPVLDSWGKEQRLRLIHLGKDIIYIAPHLMNVSDDRKAGESYAVPASWLRYCRILGTSLS